MHKHTDTRPRLTAAEKNTESMKAEKNYRELIK